jgi:acetylglutamate kinase
MKSPIAAGLTASMLLLGGLVAAPALAADPPAPKMNLVDFSNDGLIDEATAKKILAENTPAKMWKVYPASKYALVSQVEGGLNAAKTCVVTARVMLLTVTPAMKAVLFRPQKTATAFDAVANSSTDGCKALAKDKLKEATTAVMSALVKS